MLLPIIFAHSRWKVLLIAASLTAVSARFAFADPDSLTVDDEWFVAVARAESLVAGARAGGPIDSVSHHAVAEQMRLGTYVLGLLVGESISADTLLARPIRVTTSSDQPKRGWSSRVFRMTGVISAATGLLRLAASLSGVSPGTQRVLAYVGGSAAGISGIHRMRASPPGAASESVERIRMVGLESDLHDAVAETERGAESLWQDLRGMALDSCATRDQIVSLARRYANSLPAAEVLDSGVARTAAIARSCAQSPGLDPEGRERLTALATHLDETRELWQERRWLFERSRRNALDYLVATDHP
jgi:hypothetical protein